MKNLSLFVCIITVLVTASCSKDYGKDLIGKWDAGKASQESEIRVTIRGDGTFTAELTNLDVKPLTSTYTLEKDRVVFKFPGNTLDYRIIKIDNDLLVMKSTDAKITWKRLK